MVKTSFLKKNRYFIKFVFMLSWSSTDKYLRKLFLCISIYRNIRNQNLQLHITYNPIIFQSIQYLKKSCLYDR